MNCTSMRQQPIDLTNHLYGFFRYTSVYMYTTYVSKNRQQSLILQDTIKDITLEKL